MEEVDVLAVQESPVEDISGIPEVDDPQAAAAAALQRIAQQAAEKAHESKSGKKANPDPNADKNVPPGE